MSPGIYPNIGREQYDAIAAINQSTLKLFRRSPAHARHSIENPREATEAMSFGTATHCAILEPKKFADTYGVMPKYDMRKTAHKEAKADLLAANPGKSFLLQTELDGIEDMAEAVYAHPVAGELFRSKGENEVCVVWQDAETGLLCKALMDRITMYQGRVVIVDPKTTKNASQESFRWDCKKFSYHLQAAWYLHGLNVLAPAQRRFLFVAVESERPYAVGVYDLDYAWLEEGHDLCRFYLQQLAECQKTGIWPGYSSEIETLQMPYRAKDYDSE